MRKLSEWKLAQKIRASGRRGIIIGLIIAALVIVGVVLVVIKFRWVKKQFGCLHCDVDTLGDDFSDDDEEDFANEKDFV